MHRPLQKIALALVLGAAAAGCSSTQTGGQPGSSQPRESQVQSGIKWKYEDDAQPGSSPSARKGPGAGDYALAVPANIVWIPWKMVGGALKGSSDGVQAGFKKGQMPFLGAVFAPVNLAAGFVTGFFEGAAMSPGLIGPEDDFSRTMAAPTKRTTTIWWYE